MPHNLEQYDGEASFVSVREIPWHRLGTIVDEPMTVAEALRMARADFTVEKLPLVATLAETDANPALHLPVPGYMATVRRDPRDASKYITLGVVGENYTLVQNEEALSFLDELTRLHPEVVTDAGLIETVGVLGRGERVFATIRLPREIRVGKYDTTELYVAVVTSHDGSLAFTGCVTPIRMVCQNTVTAGLQSAVRTWKLNHTSGIKGRMFEARRTLELSFRYADAFEKEANELIQIPLTRDQQAKALEEIWKFPVPEPTDRMVANRDEKVGTVLSLTAADPAAGTAWGLWNGFVEYVDFYSRTLAKNGDKGKGQLAKAAALSWGALADEKARAFGVVKELATA